MRREKAWGAWLARSVGTLAVSAAILAAAPEAARGEERGTGTQTALGVGSALCTMVYGPAKILYAAGGTLLSGLAWMATGGDSHVASPILYAAVRGDYVVVPDHLTLERPLEFIGRQPEPEGSLDFE